MKRYQTYKPSGIEWLGEIPEDWEVRRLKDISIVATGSRNTEDKLDDGKYPFFVRSQTVEYIDTYSFNGEAILTAGDGVGVAKVFHHYIGKFETHQRVYRISNFPKCNGRFLFYFLMENVYKEVLKFNVKSTVDSLRMPMFLQFPVLLPTKSAQTAIANYLDTKTAAIDRKIELLTAKADKYKALRRSLINKTVCRGLNPNAPLKDSGIEWIGMIPEHWEVKRVKEIFYIGRGRVIGQDELVDEGRFPVFSSQTENNGCLGYIDTFDFNTTLLTWTTDGANAGTLFKREGRFNCTNVCGTLKPKKRKENLDFILYVLQIAAKHNKRIDTNGAKIMNNEMSVIPLLYPPTEEQNDIAKFLNVKTTQIDTILTNISEQISKLTQLRKTLINDVVTGKIKVTE